MFTRIAIAAVVAATILQMPLASGAGAASAATGICNDPTPLKYLPPGDGVSRARQDSLARAEVAARKAAFADPEASHRDLGTGAPQAIAARRAQKEAAIRAGRGKGGSASMLSDRAGLIEACTRARRGATLGDQIRVAAERWASRAAAGVSPGYLWVDFLNQQDQLYGFWCGPATLSEVARTMATNGRLSDPVDQSTAASYMGTDQSGTSVSAMVRGLNNYVGRPVAGWDFYAFVWVSFYPTPSERDTFLSNLDFDARNGWPVVGDGWEEIGGPHLIGHPNQRIFHWFEIGGYGSYGASIYYADSATSVWSGVQPFSWYDRDALVVMLGGRGYAW